MRFAPTRAARVRRAQEQAAGLGGVVVVTVGDDVVTTIAPADLTPRRAARLGLEKTEAWTVVDAFGAPRPAQNKGCDAPHGALIDPMCGRPDCPVLSPQFRSRAAGPPPPGAPPLADNDAERSTTTPRHTVDALDGRHRPLQRAAPRIARGNRHDRRHAGPHHPPHHSPGHRRLRQRGRRADPARPDPLVHRLRRGVDRAHPDR